MRQHSGAAVPQPRLLAGILFLATVGQLVVAALASDLPQFAGKGFGARLFAYPLLMLAAPLAWQVGRLVRGTRQKRRPPLPSLPPLPWAGFALLMAPFLIDVTGNTLNLYDSIAWWDDANHFVNWFLLCLGVGVLLHRGSIRPRWALGWLVAGIGAILAIAWEIAEWYAFIRHGTELATAYEDTLGDEALGTLGGALAGVLIVLLARAR